MNEFKDYATMVEEKKIKAKKKRDEAKELRLEANFKERQERYKTWEEDRDIIRNVREHFTAEQIANGEYFTLNGTQENQDNIIERLEILDKSIKGFCNDNTMFIDYKLKMLDERLDMLEGKPPYYLCKEDLMRR